jgi:DNA-binding transcriptional MerR regulator
MSQQPQQFYKPAEACRIAEVAPYVLRYWETEFSALSEGRDKGSARLYSARDVRIISRIRELLYDEGFTVAGAKKRLDAEISEGRFDEGGKPAPSPAEQRKKPPEAAPLPLEIAAPPDRSFAEKRSNPRASGEGAGFPERRKVIQELREILRLLDRSKHG